MRVLVAPLNWGLGHAARCVPLIRRLQAQGHQVMLAGDGESLALLRQHFPTLAVLPLAPLTLQYSRHHRQVWAMLRALPALIRSAWSDHRMLDAYLRSQPIDQVISDNRFGFYSRRVHSVYITHQLTIALPRPWQWLEPVLAACHRRIISRYSECWVPDMPAAADGAQGLAGRLSHPDTLPPHTRYIGVLSRFEGVAVTPDSAYRVVALLSGLEPQRTMFEREIISRYRNTDDTVLLIRGRMQGPPTVIRHRNITILPRLGDRQLAAYLTGAERIICRSGYSSVMDMYALGVTGKVEWHPTPGQPEQEYLAQLLSLA